VLCFPGNTALHDCAESGSLEIMKLLLQNGAVLMKDSYGISPVMAAAVAGFRNIIDYLASRRYVSRQEHVEALELLGATYVDKKRDSIEAVKV
jgi:ankyrin repeat protein